MDKPLAIIGEEDFILGFKALGFKVYPVKEPREFEKALDEVVNEKNAVCLVQDDIYRILESRINLYRNLALPIFIPFGKDANTGLLEKMVKDMRLRATGTF